ncbi:hypothetical protein ABZ816_15830 [Actinosynnema sp. NPDC047251]|uniref:OsmC family protein n=1 Tax=Saccharothrix espanaensis (strain ATCC 51144 / DSM 44229 / JCM 9112 / NBRC 15066 / NRRL 15764) TaxID=1179773 RepID=K0JXQ3_SACES|nr:hypothetical protein [Saccharothrix espanaensis]CCH29509.1 hypothetical protein BN6_21870 [Saccharothrix espanaensis DSM 44229]
MTISTGTTTCTAVVSDGVVEAAGVRDTLPVGDPAEPGNRWTAERLYAASLATALRVALVRLGAERGADLTGVAVRADISTGELGGVEQVLDVTLRVVEPDDGPPLDRELVESAAARCPLVAGWRVDVG